MTQLVLAHRAEPFSRHVRTTSVVLRVVMARVGAWRLRQRQRALLASLSDTELQDIGVSRAQANFEAEKPFWRY